VVEKSLQEINICCYNSDILIFLRIYIKNIAKNRNRNIINGQLEEFVRFCDENLFLPFLLCSLVFPALMHIISCVLTSLGEHFGPLRCTCALSVSPYNCANAKVAGRTSKKGAMQIGASALIEWKFAQREYTSSTLSGKEEVCAVVWRVSVRDKAE
jgi:hypothetical protein